MAAKAFAMKSLIAALLLIATQTGCLTDRKWTPPKTPLFPLGMYTHRVRIQKPVTPYTNMSLTGIVVLSANKITMTGLTPMMSTLFRVQSEMGSSDPQIEIFDPQLKTYEPQMARLFVLIKRILLLDRKELAEPLSIWAPGGKIKISADQWNAQKIPGILRVESPKLMLTIEVVKYELAKAS
jgi:hypothetical protein